MPSITQLPSWADVYDGDTDLPAELRWPRSVATHRKMRLDPQLESLLSATWLPILRTPWRLDGAGCRPEVAELVAADLGLPLAGSDDPPLRTRTRGRFSWSDHLSHACLQDVYGHSGFQQIYEIDPAGRTRLRKLLWIPPWTIADLKVADDGGMVSITQHGKTRPVPISELVWYANDREGANWLGVSMLRAPFRAWLLKDRLQRVGVLSIERNGMGVVVYTAAPRDGDEDPDGSKARADIAEGLKIATAVRAGETAGASLPPGATLELQGVAGSLPDSTTMIRYLDEQMARRFLGHFLDLLGASAGSRALGSTLADFFVLALQAKAGHLADIATAHIVEDLVDLNFGPDEPAPRIVCDEIGSQQPVTAEALKILRDAGLLDDDELLKRFVRLMYRLPANDDPQEVSADEE